MENGFASFAKHSLVYGTAELLKKGIGFIMIPIYTAYLLPKDFGLLELLDLTINITGMFIGLRLGSALIRYHLLYDTDEDKQAVFSTALLAVGALSIALLAVTLPLGPFISRSIAGSAEYSREFEIALICLAIQSVYLVGESQLLAQKRSVVYSILSIVTLITSLSLNILFLVVLRMGVLGIMLSMLLAKSLNGILVLILTVRGVPLRFSWSKLKEMVSYGLPLIPAALGMFVMHFSDRFFIQKYCDLNDLGLYSLGYKFGTIISVLITAPIFRIWNTQRFEIAKDSNPGPVYSRFLTIFTFILLFSGLGISLFADETVKLMATSAYDGAGKIVPIVVLGYVLFSLSGFFTLGNMVSGYTKAIAVNQISAALLNILLNFLLISRFGAMGAAWATLISFGALAVLNFIASQRTLHIPVDFVRIASIFVVATAAFSVSSLIKLPIVWMLALQVILLMAFPVVLFFMGVFPKNELMYAKSIVLHFFSRSRSSVKI